MCSPRLLGRRRTVHEILGGGGVADVMLWRRKDITVAILLGTFAAWILFEKSGYTLISLASSVLLFLFSILFIWAKAAGILNRPEPPLPELHLSEETVKEALFSIHSYVNAIISAWHDISRGRDDKLFYQVAAFLWLISIVGSWTDLLTLGCISLVLLLTVPALYERFEDSIENCIIIIYREMQYMYDYNTACYKVARRWFMEKRELFLEMRKLS